MRIERITLDLCVADRVTRDQIISCFNCDEDFHDIVRAFEVIECQPHPAPKKKQTDSSKKPEQPKQKRKYTKRSEKWTAANTERTNGETETVKDGQQEGEKIIFRT